MQYFSNKIMKTTTNNYDGGGGGHRAHNRNIQTT